MHAKGEKTPDMEPEMRARRNTPTDLEAKGALGELADDGRGARGDRHLEAAVKGVDEGAQARGHDLREDGVVAGRRGPRVERAVGHEDRQVGWEIERCMAVRQAAQDDDRQDGACMQWQLFQLNLSSSSP